MNQKFTSGKFLVTFIIALVGCVAIWVAVPYNNFLLSNTWVSDWYLPEVVIALIILLAVGINPLLGLISKSLVLDRRQLALIASLLLFAAVIPGNGLMRMFPRFVAEINQSMNTNVTSARIAAEEGDFRPELFPDGLPTVAEDGSIKSAETPVSDAFLDELDEGESVPWGAWVMPMFTWGIFITAMWMMMLGLGGVVFPQWRDRERLPFPLLNVYQSLTGSSDEANDRKLPAVFYSRGFWVTCGVVFCIHGMRALNEFTGSFPSIPLDWSLKQYYTDTIFRHAGAPLQRQHIFFALIGVAYFIPNRYSVSVWGWSLGFAVYVMFGRQYIPAFSPGINNQAFGAMFAIAVWVLWLGRAHWHQVGRAMLGQAGGTPESKRNSIAGWMFAIGCAGMVCWLVWAGCGVWWSITATATAAIISLLMARIVAETGIPFLWFNRITVSAVMGLVPLAWQSPNTLLFGGAFYALVTRASAVSAAVIATLALGMDRQATPKHHSRVLLGGLVVLVLGLVVCGAVHLNMGYHSPEVSTAAKTSATSLNVWDRADRENFRFFTAERGQQAFGFGMGTALLWACSRFPSWPIHPVGILFCQFSIGHLIWFSIFLGWLLKVTTTSLFGGGAYRKARPVFLGLILGELLAIIVWAIVPIVIILWTGADPSEVSRYILIQYP